MEESKEKELPQRKPQVEAQEKVPQKEAPGSVQEKPTDRSIDEVLKEAREIAGRSQDQPSSGEQISSPEQTSSAEKPPWLFIALALVIILIIGLVIIFLTKGKKKTEPITLTYWGLWEPESVVQGMIADWEKDNPNIKVQYIKQDKNDYRARLQSAFSRGEGPDIFRFHATWLPVLKNDLAPLPNTVVASLGLDDNYFPIVVDLLKTGGQFYGVPLMIDTLALYYNKDILDAANKSPPITWWGLENLAKELTVRPDQRISLAGVALGTTNNVDHWSDIIGLMIYQNGGRPDEIGALVEDVLKYYLRFKNTAKVWDETLPNSTLAFSNGKLAFYFGPSWRVFNLLEANPNLNFGITTVPQLPKLKETDWEAAEKGEEELTNIGWASFWTEGVAVKSEYQEESWLFLEFLGSKETLQKLYTAQSQIRLFGEIYPRSDLASSLESDPLIGSFVKQAKVSQSWYLSSFTHDAIGVNERIIKYYENAINALDQGEREEKVLETLNSGLGQVLGQYGI